MASVKKLTTFSKGPYQGRDKFAKCLQFALRQYTYYALEADPKNAFAAKMVLFMKQLAVARKGLRLGKSVEELFKLQVALAAKKDIVSLTLDIVTSVGMIFRWGYDNLAFLEKAKVLEKADYGITSNKFRVVATVAYIIQCVRAVLKANAGVAAAKDPEEVKKAKKTQWAAQLALFARGCDIFNALHSAKFYQTESIQGWCGFLSSYIAFKKVWDATKA